MYVIWQLIRLSIIATVIIISHMRLILFFFLDIGSLIKTHRYNTITFVIIFFLFIIPISIIHSRTPTPSHTSGEILSLLYDPSKRKMAQLYISLTVRSPRARINLHKNRNKRTNIKSSIGFFLITENIVNNAH